VCCTGNGEENDREKDVLGSDNDIICKQNLDSRMIFKCEQREYKFLITLLYKFQENEGKQVYPKY
jgi:hypothetical protein